MRTQPSFSPYSSVSRAQVGQALDELSERAQRIHLSLHHLARAAGVPPSMLSQWRHGVASATGRTFEFHLTKLARQLAVEEDALREYLSPKARRRA